jgi:hypothetical protein
MEVVVVKICRWNLSCFDTEWQYITHWCRVYWGRASKSNDLCGEIHFTGCFRSMEGSFMAASLLVIIIWTHRGLWRYSSRMLLWTATQSWSLFFYFWQAEREISADAFQQICRVSPTWYDHGSRQILLLKQDTMDNFLPSTLPQLYAMLLYLLLGQVSHLQWWLTTYFADGVDR